MLLVFAGLAGESRQGLLFLSPENFGDHQTYGDNDERSSIPIHLVRGEDLITPHSGRVDFIKIDTQGAEMGVISGMKNLIMRSLPGLKMIVEFWPYGLRRAGYDGEALLNLLVSFGFAQFYIIRHAQSRLEPVCPADLLEWVRRAEKKPDFQGFLDLLCEGEN